MYLSSNNNACTLKVRLPANFLTSKILCKKLYLGEGISMDHEFIDKFGVPNKLEHFWMEGYHSMDRRLARHMFSVGHEQIPFPPVAGYAGMLYK